MKTLFIYLSVWLFVSCAPKVQQAPLNTQALTRQWMLTKMKGFTKEELMKAGAFIDLTDLKKTNGRAGCNRIGFNTQADAAGHIQFSGVLSTRMYCEPFMKLEDAFIELLKHISGYKVEGHHIRFYDAKNKLLAEAVAADWD
ncbi:MAG: META domain-containing protein [Niabella sp.]|nr:META domain-containing protein [Niabella sp.]